MISNFDALVFFGKSTWISNSWKRRLLKMDCLVASSNLHDIRNERSSWSSSWNAVRTFYRKADFFTKHIIVKSNSFKFWDIKLINLAPFSKYLLLQRPKAKFYDLLWNLQYLAVTNCDSGLEMNPRCQPNIEKDKKHPTSFVHNNFNQCSKKYQ